IKHRRERPGGDMQRRGESGQPVKGRPKVRKEPTAHLSTDHSPEQFDRLKRERDEALEQLAATSEAYHRKLIRRTEAGVSDDAGEGYYGMRSQIRQYVLA